MFVLASARAWIEAIGSAIGAIGAMLAVATALWLQFFLERSRRPHLVITCWDEPDAAPFSPTYAKGHESLWLRLRVTNKPRPRLMSRHTAEDVEVVLNRVWKRPEGPGRTLMPVRPLKWADLKQGQVNVAAGMSRYVDVAHLGRLTPGREADMRLSLRLWPPEMDDEADDPDDDRHRLRPGMYDIELVLSARGVDAVYYVATVRFDAVWEEDPANLHVWLGLCQGRLEEGGVPESELRSLRPEAPPIAHTEPLAETLVPAGVDLR